MVRSEKTLNRFLAKVELIPFHSCWQWVGASDKYGSFKLRKTMGAHRAAYLLFKGPIPRNLEIDHLCRNRLCVNPNHLEAVTRRQNLKRAKRTHCPMGHLLSAANIYWVKTPRLHRRCRKCSLEKYHLQKKQGPTISKK